MIHVIKLCKSNQRSCPRLCCHLTHERTYVARLELAQQIANAAFTFPLHLSDSACPMVHANLATTGLKRLH